VEAEVAEEPAPIGLHKPLSGKEAMFVLLVATNLGIFALGSFVAALSNLSSSRFVSAIGAGSASALFAALLARFLYDFLPQRAWLERSVLTVERGSQRRQCDLASAKIIELNSTMPNLTRGYSGAVPVLRARQHEGDALVRVVLRGDDLRIVPADQLLLLAEAIESGPAPAAHAPKVCRRLRKLADKQRPLPALDWSFRTDPHGTRRTEN
jgi:hypothetical protein